jgi:predicted MFS family arabinose efflux permease
VAIAPSQASVSIALNTSAVFLGQAAGAAGASALIAHVPGTAGFTAIPWFSVPVLCLAVVLSLFASIKMRAHPQERSGSAHVQGRPA